MKEKANIKTKIAVVGIIALTLLIIGIISAPNVLQKMGVQVGEKEGEEAGTAQVLVGKTFTSSVAGVGAAGAMADYTNNLQTATVASNATGVSTINVPAGYYEQIQVDASAVYEAAYQAGRAQGQNDVINNPGTYSLYTQTQYNDNYTTGYNKGKTDGVTTHTGTYTYPANSTGATYDMGTTHTYRYVNASNVYSKGKADGKSEFSLSKNYRAVVTLTNKGTSFLYFTLNVNGNSASFTNLSSTFYAMDTCPDTAANHAIVQV